MKKFLSLFLGVLLVFSLAGCSSSEENTGVFSFSKEEMEAAEKFPNSINEKGITIKFPDNWEKYDLPGFPVAIQNNDTKEQHFMDNLTIALVPSHEARAKASIEELTEATEKALSQRGIPNGKIVKAEKGKWNGKDAIFFEMSGTVQGINLIIGQYSILGQKNDLVVSFASEASNYENYGRALNRSMLASVKYEDK